MMQIEDSPRRGVDAKQAAGLPVSPAADLTGVRVATSTRHPAGRRTIDLSLATARAAAPRGPTKIWRKHLEELRDFIAKFGRFPTNHGLQSGELELYGFLAEQRRALVAQNLGWSKMEAMSVLGDWVTTNLERERDRRWRERLGQVVEFVADHGRLPRHAPSKDEPEHSLAIWMATQHAATRHRYIPRDRLAALNEALPGWRKER